MVSIVVTKCSAKNWLGCSRNVTKNIGCFLDDVSDLLSYLCQINFCDLSTSVLIVVSIQMMPEDNLFLPHKSLRWNEIKQNILHAIESPLNLLELISHLDYIEHLGHLDQPTGRLFDVLPLRMTFIGLGNFIECLEPKKHNWLRTVLFPFIFRCALNIEQYNTDTLPYCVREQGTFCLNEHFSV